MRTELQNGYKLKLPDRVCEYEIVRLLGSGASCFVYLARYTENEIPHEVILKEYHPKSLALNRSDDGALYIPDDKRTLFESGLAYFEQGYKKQAAIRLNSDLTNVTSNIHWIHTANHTRYIEMTFSSGVTYCVDNPPTDTTLYDFFRRMKSLAVVVGCYHEAGYLHLDIKPANIFAPKTTDGKEVILFDFDSIIEKELVKKDSISLSYTKEWAAMEQINPAKRMNICEATDIFSIGEIIFYRILRRHSTLNERRSYSDYSEMLKNISTHADSIFYNVNPKIFTLLNELLKKTLCNVVSKRYKSDKELINALDDLIKLADPKESYLIRKAITPNAFFIGRERELNAIHEKLQENPKLFLSGIGGIGKSELAKNYAIRYKDNYDTILYATYTGSWMMLINDDSHIQIAHFEKYEGEKETEYYTRKLHMLAKLCDQRTLFIIDNLDEDEFFDEELNRWKSILDLDCKFIFTTRITDWNYPQITIHSLEQHKDLVSLYENYCKIDDGQQPVVDSIIDYVDGHTLTIELIAKLIAASRFSPEMTLEKLREYGIAQNEKEKVVMDKDNVRRRKTPFQHICAIFDMSKLSDTQLYIMANMALIPPDGIKTDLFENWCEIKNFDAVNHLVVSGWLNLEQTNHIIKIHPVIADAALELCTKPNPSHCQIMLKNQTNYLEKYYLKNYPDFKQTYRDVIFFNGLANNLLRSKMKTVAAADVLTSISGLIFEFNYMNEAIKYQNYACDIFQQQQGEYHLQTGNALNTLSKLYESSGDFEQALRYAKEALHVTTKPLWSMTSDHAVSAATSFKSLSTIYYHMGDFKKALRYTYKALIIQEYFLGEEDDRTLTSLNNLGEIYREMGNFKESSHYIEKTLNIKNKVFGEDHISTAKSFHNLSTLYYDMEDFDQALQYEKKALEIRKKHLGKNHTSIATTFNNLSAIYYKTKDYEQAVQCSRKSLEIKTDLLGKDNISLSTPLCNLGTLYGELGKFDQALQYTQQALNIERKAFGEMHPKMVTTLNNIAGIYESMEEFDQALQIYLQALHMAQTLFGTKHILVFVCLSNIGYLYERINNPTEAEAYYAQAYDVCRKTLGDEHPKTERVKQRLMNVKKGL